jgi:predicted outer membrane protein
MRAALLVLAMLLWLPISARADDAEFVQGVATAGWLEQELGRTAVERGRHGDVQRFGQIMLDERVRTNHELETLSRAAGILIPQQLTTSQRAEVDALAELEGPAFDQAYMQRMLFARARDLEAFRAQAAGEGAVARWAGAQLPSMEALLAEAQRVASLVGVGETAP